MAATHTVKFEYFANPAIDSEVPRTQSIRAPSQSSLDEKPPLTPDDTGATYTPVLKDSQKFLVINPMISETLIGQTITGPHIIRFHGKPENEKARSQSQDKPETSENLDKKTKIPKLIQSDKKLKEEMSDSKEREENEALKKEPPKKPRRSSIPRIKKTVKKELAENSKVTTGEVMIPQDHEVSPQPAKRNIMTRPDAVKLIIPHNNLTEVKNQSIDNLTDAPTKPHSERTQTNLTVNIIPPTPSQPGNISPVNSMTPTIQPLRKPSSEFLRVENDPKTEEEFEKIFEGIVDPDISDVKLDESILEEELDPYQLETKFEEIVNACEGQKAKPSRIPLTKRKSDNDIQVPYKNKPILKKSHSFDKDKILPTDSKGLKTFFDMDSKNHQFEKNIIKPSNKKEINDEKEIKYKPFSSEKPKKAKGISENEPSPKDDEDRKYLAESGKKGFIKKIQNVIKKSKDGKQKPSNDIENESRSSNEVEITITQKELKRNELENKDLEHNSQQETPLQKQTKLDSDKPENIMIPKMLDTFKKVKVNKDQSLSSLEPAILKHDNLGQNTKRVKEKKLFNKVQNSKENKKEYDLTGQPESFSEDENDEDKANENLKLHEPDRSQKKGIMTKIRDAINKSRQNNNEENDNDKLTFELELESDNKTELNDSDNIVPISYKEIRPLKSEKNVTKFSSVQTENPTKSKDKDTYPNKKLVSQKVKIQDSKEEAQKDRPTIHVEGNDNDSNSRPKHASQNEANQDDNILTKPAKDKTWAEEENVKGDEHKKPFKGKEHKDPEEPESPKIKDMAQKQLEKKEKIIVIAQKPSITKIQTKQNILPDPSINDKGFINPTSPPKKEKHDLVKPEDDNGDNQKPSGSKEDDAGKPIKKGIISKVRDAIKKRRDDGNDNESTGEPEHLVKDEIKQDDQDEPNKPLNAEISTPDDNEMTIHNEHTELQSQKVESHKETEEFGSISYKNNTQKPLQTGKVADIKHKLSPPKPKTKVNILLVRPGPPIKDAGNVHHKPPPEKEEYDSVKPAEEIEETQEVSESEKDMSNKKGKKGIVTKIRDSIKETKDKKEKDFSEPAPLQVESANHDNDKMVYNAYKELKPEKLKEHKDPKELESPTLKDLSHTPLEKDKVLAIAQKPSHHLTIEKTLPEPPIKNGEHDLAETTGVTENKQETSEPEQENSDETVKKGIISKIRDAIKKRRDDGNDDELISEPEHLDKDKIKQVNQNEPLNPINADDNEKKKHNEYKEPKSQKLESHKNTEELKNKNKAHKPCEKENVTDIKPKISPPKPKTDENILLARPDPPIKEGGNAHHKPSLEKKDHDSVKPADKIKEKQEPSESEKEMSDKQGKKSIVTKIREVIKEAKEKKEKDFSEGAPLQVESANDDSVILPDPPIKDVEFILHNSQPKKEEHDLAEPRGVTENKQETLEPEKENSDKTGKKGIILKVRDALKKRRNDGNDGELNSEPEYLHEEHIKQNDNNRYLTPSKTEMSIANDNEKTKLSPPKPITKENILLVRPGPSIKDGGNVHRKPPPEKEEQDSVKPADKIEEPDDSENEMSDKQGKKGIVSKVQDTIKGTKVKKEKYLSTNNDNDKMVHNAYKELKPLVEPTDVTENKQETLELEEENSDKTGKKGIISKFRDAIKKKRNDGNDDELNSEPAHLDDKEMEQNDQNSHPTPFKTETSTAIDNEKTKQDEQKDFKSQIVKSHKDIEEIEHQKPKKKIHKPFEKENVAEIGQENSPSKLQNKKDIERPSPVITDGGSIDHKFPPKKEKCDSAKPTDEVKEKKEPSVSEQESFNKQGTKDIEIKIQDVIKEAKDRKEKDYSEAAPLQVESTKDDDVKMVHKVFEEELERSKLKDKAHKPLEKEKTSPPKLQTKDNILPITDSGFIHHNPPPKKEEHDLVKPAGKIGIISKIRENIKKSKDDGNGDESTCEPDHLDKDVIKLDAQYRPPKPSKIEISTADDTEKSNHDEHKVLKAHKVKGQNYIEELERLQYKTQKPFEKENVDIIEQKPTSKLQNKENILLEQSDLHVKDGDIILHKLPYEKEEQDSVEPANITLEKQEPSESEEGMSDKPGVVTKIRETIKKRVESDNKGEMIGYEVHQNYRLPKPEVSYENNVVILHDNNTKFKPYKVKTFNETEELEIKEETQKALKKEKVALTVPIFSPPKYHTKEMILPERSDHADKNKKLIVNLEKPAAQASSKELKQFEQSWKQHEISINEAEITSNAPTIQSNIFKIRDKLTREKIDTQLSMQTLSPPSVNHNVLQKPIIIKEIVKNLDEPTFTAPAESLTENTKKYEFNIINQKPFATKAKNLSNVYQIPNKENLIDSKEVFGAGANKTEESLNIEQSNLNYETEDEEYLKHTIIVPKKKSVLSRIALFERLESSAQDPHKSRPPLNLSSPKLFDGPKSHQPHPILTPKSKEVKEFKKTDDTIASIANNSRTDIISNYLKAESNFEEIETNYEKEKSESITPINAVNKGTSGAEDKFDKSKLAKNVSEESKNLNDRPKPRIPYNSYSGIKETQRLKLTEKQAHRGVPLYETSNKDMSSVNDESNIHKTGADKASVDEESNLKKAPSLVDLELGDVIKGKVNDMIQRMISVDTLAEEKKETINVKERPRRRTVTDRIALFESMVGGSLQNLRPNAYAMNRKKKLQPMDAKTAEDKGTASTTDGAKTFLLSDEEYAAKIAELKNSTAKYGKVEKMPVLDLRDGAKMPVLAVGTALLDPKLIPHIIEAAISMGYRAVDTAYIYGNMREVGQGLRAKIDDGTVQRKDLFIMNKLWSTFHRPDLVEKACRESLDEMGLDYFDLLMIHNPMSFKEGEDPIPKIANVLQYSEFDYLDAWFAMEGLVTKGLVRSVGVSNFNSEQLARINEKAKVKVAVNQVECHPYLSQVKLADFCDEHGVVLSCYGTLGSKGTPADYKAPGSTPVIDDAFVTVMAAGLSMTPAQLLIRYQLESGRAVVVKASTAARLWENLQAIGVKMTEREVEALNGLNKNKRTFLFKGMGDTHKNYPFKIPF